MFKREKNNWKTKLWLQWTLSNKGLDLFRRGESQCHDFMLNKFRYLPMQSLIKDTAFIILKWTILFNRYKILRKKLLGLKQSSPTSPYTGGHPPRWCDPWGGGGPCHPLQLTTIAGKLPSLSLWLRNGIQGHKSDLFQHLVMLLFYAPAASSFLSISWSFSCSFVHISPSCIWLGPLKINLFVSRFRFSRIFHLCVSYWFVVLILWLLSFLSISLIFWCLTSFGYCCRLFILSFAGILRGVYFWLECL